MAFGKPIPVYSLVSLYNDEHYKKYGIPVKSGMVTERESLDFKHDKDSIGFYKIDSVPDELYPLHKLDDEGDKERRSIRMMYLREEMRLIGQKIASEIEIDSIWPEPDFIELKSSRDIQAEDEETIKVLAKLPKRIPLSHHNYFSLNSSNIAEVINRDLARADKELAEARNDNDKQRLQEEVTYLEMFQKLSDNYDWTTLWNVNTVLERRKIENRVVQK